MSRRIRIAYVVTELEVGGAEKCLFELVRRLDRRRFAPRVYGLAGPGPIAGWLQRERVPVHCLGARGSWDGCVAWRLWRHLCRHRFDLVHTFLFHANIIGRLAARAAGVPHVVSSLRVAERRFRWHLLLDRWTFAAVDVETCVSDDVRRFAIQHAGIPASRLVVVPNGLDLDRYASARPIPHEDLDLPADARVALFVGRLDPQKGVDALLEAARALHTQRPDTDLYWLVAGSGPMESWIRHRVGQLWLSDRVRLLGWRDDVPRLLKTASVVVLPSRWEGMANVALEAMAAGTPLVASNVEGMRQLAGRPPTIHLIPPGAPDRLAASVAHVLDRPDHAARLAHAAVERVHAHFSLDRMAHAYQDLYEHVLS